MTYFSILASQEFHEDKSTALATRNACTVLVGARRTAYQLATLLRLRRQAEFSPSENRGSVFCKRKRRRRRKYKARLTILPTELSNTHTRTTACHQQDLVRLRARLNPLQCVGVGTVPSQRRSGPFVDQWRLLLLHALPSLRVLLSWNVKRKGVDR